MGRIPLGSVWIEYGMIPIIHANSLEEFSKYDNSFDHLLSAATVKKYRETLGFIGDFLNECQVQGRNPSLEEIIQVFNESVQMMGEDDGRQED